MKYLIICLLAVARCNGQQVLNQFTVINGYHTNVVVQTFGTLNGVSIQPSYYFPVGTTVVPGMAMPSNLVFNVDGATFTNTNPTNVGTVHNNNSYQGQNLTLAIGSQGDVYLSQQTLTNDFNFYGYWYQGLCAGLLFGGLATVVWIIRKGIKATDYVD